MNTPELIMLTAVVTASAAGQLLLRYGAKKWVTDRGFLPLVISAVKSTAALAFLLIMGAPLVYWKVLETVPLSHAYAVTALTGVLIQIGSHFFLKEKLSHRMVAGALLCCTGIAVWGL